MVKALFSSHTAWVSSVDWSQKNEHHFLSAGYDKTMKMWDMRSPGAPLYDLSGHQDRILCCDWTEADMLISGSADSTVKIFRAAK